jgi:TetR/AcrR family transcriptional regulator, transcriptional repressor for nem operon
MARPRKFDEGEVLLAARQQFWHQGYEATSMADLVKATGIASQSLYGAFGSKHDLFVRTLTDYCTSQVAGLAASEAANERAATSAWAWLMAAVTFDDGGRLGLGEDGCYLSGSAVALARLDADVQDAARTTYDGILEIFRLALARARDIGELQAGVDVDQAAYALLTAMQGIEFLRKASLAEDEFDQAKSAAVATLTRAYAA